MKKIKILTPILATATIGSMVVPLVTLASCNKNETSEITLDESTTKAEQTTTDDKTITTYAFNLKNKLNIVTNDETESEDIEVEAEDIETTDDITVEVSALQYDAVTGKIYVTITTSKEDGTLNDGETVTFSLNFHCLGRKSRKQRWEKKLTNFVIKHSSGQIWSGHFNDTDVTKKIKTLTTGPDSITINFPAAETWKETPGEGEYDLSKLKCYVLTDQDRRHFIETVTLPKYDTELEITLGDDGESIDVKVPYEISSLAVKDHTTARFTLLFTYPDSTVFQTIGGFSINYVSTLEEEHLTLASSREQHYYEAQSTDAETGCNFIGFWLDMEVESGPTYVEDDFTITASDTRIKIDAKNIFTSVSGYQFLSVAYHIETTKENSNPLPTSKNIYNVTLKVESKNAASAWTKELKGFSFYNGNGRFDEGKIIYSDTSKLPTSYSAGGSTPFNDILRTCKPYDLTQLQIIHSYATIDEGTQEEIIADFEISELYWDYETKSYYSRAELDGTNVDAGQHNVKIYVYVIAPNASYYYCLTVGTVIFE